ncbi:MFS transporter [Micromonospora sp. WMMD1102]|uniref:MFS transporter n=1 Tax=Micromonospora sp. WMMD1102 TaxID=3016105 RepID=UPI0024156333|nr:MFS transporter [Micromonospora sp. WMMD1102]MDG4791769.1 MFS transporter [Micromonospora sp. WMMD1102]
MATGIAGRSGGRAGRREYLGLAVLGLPTVLIALDMSVLYLAVPHLTEDLGASALQQLWITDIYGFVVSGFLIMMGSLGDRIGRRRLLLIGAALFAVMSIVAALSSSPEMLIAARAGLGVAGATLMPSTMTLLRSMFTDPAQYMKAIGVWMACFMGGIAFGPVIGGVLLQYFWWGSVFLLGVPVMAVLLLFGPRLLPEYRNPDAGPLDVVSALFSLATVLPIIYGLKELVQHGAGPVQFLALTIGVSVGVLFVRRQRVLAVPMLELSLFGNRTFRSAITMVVFGGVMAGTNFFVYQYLQTVQGLEPLPAALWLLPSSITIIVGLNIAPRLGQRIRPAYVIAAGLIVVTIGYLVLAQAGDGPSGLAVLITGLVISGVGIGPMGALGAGLALGSVPMDKAGSAASTNQVAGDFGIAMGVALIGVVGTTVYQDQVADRLPADLPASAANSARESVAGALSVSPQLGEPLRGQLIETAQAAFTTAMHYAAFGSALVAVLLAILAVTTLRHVPPTGGAPVADASPEEAPATPAAAISNAE